MVPTEYRGTFCRYGYDTAQIVTRTANSELNAVFSAHLCLDLPIRSATRQSISGLG